MQNKQINLEELAFESASIVDYIKDFGPFGVADFMDLCLSHPTWGYYMAKDPFGRGGDFTTAPEISQLFGEMIALYFLNIWQTTQQQGCFIELGPGRGTLMADIRRTAQIRPDFVADHSFHLVEISPFLKEKQQETLSFCPDICWHDSLGQALEKKPLFLIANEFLDALGCQQYVMTSDGWQERCVFVDDHQACQWGTFPEDQHLFVNQAYPFDKKEDISEGAVCEISLTNVS